MRVYNKIYMSITLLLLLLLQLNVEVVSLQEEVAFIAAALESHVAGMVEVGNRRGLYA